LLEGQFLHVGVGHGRNPGFGGILESGAGGG
jgi:hypothetical protein